MEGFNKTHIPKKNLIVNDVRLVIGNDQVPNKPIASVLNKAFDEVGLRLQTPSGNTSEGELNMQFANLIFACM